MDQDKLQLRQAAQCSWHLLQNEQRADILRLKKHLEECGFKGTVACISADAVIYGWTEAGWVKISPNRSELRLTETGIEQLAQWKDEDDLWEQGANEGIKFAKRLKAGQPATNLLKIAEVIGNGIMTDVFDPYTDALALRTLLKLNGMGVKISKGLRLLRKPIIGVAAQTLASSLNDLNVEMSTQWELRATIKPHRRFLVLQDKTVITLGLSLNDVNKDEALDRIPTNDNRAAHDCKFFDDCWAKSTAL